MASTGAYAGGDYGRGDGDARVNRAPPPAQGMPASKDEVEEAPAIDWDDPANYRYNYRLPILPKAHDKRKREVYGEGKDGEKVLVRLNMAMKGGQGCCGPSQMLRGKDRFSFGVSDGRRRRWVVHSFTSSICVYTAYI